MQETLFVLSIAIFQQAHTSQLDMLLIGSALYRINKKHNLMLFISIFTLMFAIKTFSISIFQFAVHEIYLSFEYYICYSAISYPFILRSSCLVTLESACCCALHSLITSCLFGLFKKPFNLTSVSCRH